MRLFALFCQCFTCHISRSSSAFTCCRSCTRLTFFPLFCQSTRLLASSSTSFILSVIVFRYLVKVFLTRPVALLLGKPAFQVADEGIVLLSRHAGHLHDGGILSLTACVLLQLGLTLEVLVVYLLGTRYAVIDNPVGDVGRLTSAFQHVKQCVAHIVHLIRAAFPNGMHYLINALTLTFRGKEVVDAVGVVLLAHATGLVASQLVTQATHVVFSSLYALPVDGALAEVRGYPLVHVLRLQGISTEVGKGLLVTGEGLTGQLHLLLGIVLLLHSSHHPLMGTHRGLVTGGIQAAQAAGQLPQLLLTAHHGTLLGLQLCQSIYQCLQFLAAGIGQTTAVVGNGIAGI